MASIVQWFGKCRIKLYLVHRSDVIVLLFSSNCTSICSNAELNSGDIKSKREMPWTAGPPVYVCEQMCTLTTHVTEVGAHGLEGERSDQSAARKGEEGGPRQGNGGAKGETRGIHTKQVGRKYR